LRIVEPVIEAFFLDRPADVIALGAIAIHVFQEIVYLTIFHTLGNDFHAEIIG